MKPSQQEPIWTMYLNTDMSVIPGDIAERLVNAIKIKFNERLGISGWRIVNDLFSYNKFQSIELHVNAIPDDYDTIQQLESSCKEFFCAETSLDHFRSIRGIRQIGKRIESIPLI